MDKLNGEDCTICRPATNAPEFKQVGGMDKVEAVKKILHEYNWEGYGATLIEASNLAERICQLFKAQEEHMAELIDDVIRLEKGKLKLPNNPYSGDIDFHQNIRLARRQGFDKALQQVKEDNPHLEVE